MDEITRFLFGLLGGALILLGLLPASLEMFGFMYGMAAWMIVSGGLLLWGSGKLKMEEES